MSLYNKAWFRGTLAPLVRKNHLMPVSKPHSHIWEIELFPSPVSIVILRFCKILWVIEIQVFSLSHRCQTLSQQPNWAHSSILCGLQDNTKSWLQTLLWVLGKEKWGIFFLFYYFIIKFNLKLDIACVQYLVIECTEVLLVPYSGWSKTWIHCPKFPLGRFTVLMCISLSIHLSLILVNLQKMLISLLH